MDNEHNCGLDCGEITGSPMEILQGCREHARSRHMLTWIFGPEPEPEQRGNGFLTSAQQRCPALLLCVCDFISNIILAREKAQETSNMNTVCLHQTNFKHLAGCAVQSAKSPEYLEHKKERKTSL